MTEPITDARLAEIDALAAQYRDHRAAAQIALIDHDRNEVLRQEAYAASVAQVLAEESTPQMLAEIRRSREVVADARADRNEACKRAAHWEEAARKNGDLYAACENQRDEARAEVERLRAANHPHVAGSCPACGRASLFLATGGYVTCAQADCPQPDAASDRLAAKEAQ